MLQKILSIFIISVMLISCAEQENSIHQSQNVTIYRDAWGVPHIHGQTDGDTAFGMAYAQAEDNFSQLEQNFILAIGRSAEVFGEEALLGDWVVRAMEIPELSKRDYENASPKIKSLLEGYAAGLNYYIENHPDLETVLLTHFEPWYPLALIRRMYYTGGFLGRLRFSGSERQAAFEEINDAPLRKAQLEHGELTEYEKAGKGSNSWAANGDKIEGTGAYLFINPHLPAFGMGQVYEAHMISDEGWNFTGYSRFGFPLPYVGFNDKLGWASTDNNGDQEDAWIEHFGEDENPLNYKYGDGFLKAHEWEGEIKVKGEETRKVKFLKTHHGPVLAKRDGKFMSARLATFDEPGWLDQWYNMGRAQNYDEFIEAVRPLKMQFGNYMYADRAGNILYVYNGAFPKRDESFDWNNPVDGSDPKTDWQGYHSLEEIPQTLNPPTHFVQNTNTTPFMTSMSDADPREEDFPTYMVRESDNARSVNARRILMGRDTFDFETWERESLDTTVTIWNDDKAYFIQALESLKGSDNSLIPVIDLLLAWDGKTSLEAFEPTLYADWFEGAFQARGMEGIISVEDTLFILDGVVARLERDWGTWQVKWGDISRAQRPSLDERGNPQFCDECPSIATPGIHAWSGSSQISWNLRRDGLKKRYKTGGNSYTAIIDFPNDPKEKIKAKSIHVFGANADPNSPHHMDQAELLAQKKYKPAWLYLEDVKANANRAYKPGNEN